MNLRNNNHNIIMHLISSDFYGGPEKQIIEHICRSDQKYFKYILSSFITGKRKNELLRKADKIGIKAFGIKSSGPFDFKSIKYLSNVIRNENVDLICTHGYKSTVIGWTIARRYRIPVLAFSRGYTTENKKVAFYEWLERIVLRKTDGIICVSEGQKEKLEKYGLKNKKIWVVYNSVFTESPFFENDSKIKKNILREIKLPSEARVIVSAGRLSPEKGHRYLVDAIPLVIHKYPNAHFIFCGDGQCKNRLEKKAIKLNIQKNCHFIGFRKDLPEIFKIMEFQVLPSLTEGLPNVLLEGFSHSRTVVATAVGGVPEIVIDNKNGILVPPYNSAAIADAILTLLDNPEMSRQMGREGFDKVKRDFNFEHQTNKLREIYQDILSK